jgi:hypothetical protein
MQKSLTTLTLVERRRRQGRRQTVEGQKIGVENFEQEAAIFRRRSEAFAGIEHDR